MIKIATLLNAQSQQARKAAQDLQPTSRKHAQAEGLKPAAAPYPSKKLTLKDGQYVATDHER